MFYMYILKSKKNESLYVGFTNDLKKRVSQHNQGTSPSTKRYAPWELIYYEAYKARQDATVREKQLKRFAKGFSMLKRRIKNSLVFQG